MGHQEVPLGHALIQGRQVQHSVHGAITGGTIERTQWQTGHAVRRPSSLKSLLHIFRLACTGKSYQVMLWVDKDWHWRSA